MRSLDPSRLRRGDDVRWPGGDGTVVFEAADWDPGANTIRGEIVSSDHPHHPEGAMFRCALDEAQFEDGCAVHGSSYVYRAAAPAGRTYLDCSACGE